MAHVYNPRGWQRAPGSSLASQSRLTEGPQVPGRPTLFFFWAAISRLISDLYLHASLHIHMYSQPVHTTCTYKETLSRHKQAAIGFETLHCLQSESIVGLFVWGGGVCVYSLIYPRLALNPLCTEGDAEVLFLLPPPPSAGSQHSLHPVYMVLRLEPRVSCMSDNTTNSATFPILNLVL